MVPDDSFKKIATAQSLPLNIKGIPLVCLQYHLCNCGGYLLRVVKARSLPYEAPASFSAANLFI